MDAADRSPDLARLAERLGAAATGATEVAVGLGILGVNRLQALRRQVATRLAEATASPADDAT